jgi:hypothetical protein
LQIEDELETEGQHTYTIYYHLGPGWRAGNMQRESDCSVTFALEGPSSVSFRLSASTAMEASVEQVPISRVFGTVAPAECLVMTTRHKGSLKAMACLSWHS